MARTRLIVALQPSRIDQRPNPVPLRQPGFNSNIGNVIVTQLDADSVILMPEAYNEDPDDSPEAKWRDEYSASQCWKTTAIYEQIGEAHPHLVAFNGRDPWTALPILAKPSNLPVNDFIAQHKDAMYTAPLDAAPSRLSLSYRPLAYQWALHIVDGLAFVHSHHVIFGDLDLSQCWLSSDSHLSLSLAGFVHASFNYTARWGHCISADRTNMNNFHPLEHQRHPTVQTDIFLFGCVLFELMTGYWPGTRSGLGTWQEIAALISRRAWPPLEDISMGRIVHQCWDNEFASAEQVKAALMSFLRDRGEEVDGECNLQSVDAALLFKVE